MTLSPYENDGFYDEMFDADSRPRSGAAALIQRIAALEEGELLRHQQAAEQALLNLGITFNVYGDEAGTERIFPFDIVPRIVDASDWSFIERGLKQRVQARNCFIDDIYHDQKIIGSGLVPADLIESAKGYLKPCLGLSPPQGVWCHINGTDLVRDRDGQLYVLEDNLRCPSGVSYVLKNRRCGSNVAEQRLGRVRSELNYARIQEIINNGLHEFLDTFQLKLNEVDDAIYDTFFALHPLGDKARTAPDPLPRATQTQTQTVEPRPRGA